MMILAALCIIPQLFAQQRELILYTWEEMIPGEILSGFERETGIKVVYETFDTNEEMLDRLVENGGGGFASIGVFGGLGYYWSATEYGTLGAWLQDITGGGSQVQRHAWTRISGLSLRCVMND
jgi:hypothetical protein